MSLRWRLALGFALAAAAIIAVTGLGFLLQLRSTLTSTLDGTLGERADLVAHQLRGETPTALRLDLDDQPSQVLAADGRVLAWSRSAGPHPMLDAVAVGRVLAAPAGAPHAPFTLGDGDRRVRWLAVPGGRARTVVVVGVPTRVADAAYRHVEDGLLLLGPPAVLAAGLGAGVLAGRALRPVERMRRRAAEISAADSDARLPHPGTHDEIARLAVTLNDLLDRMRAALARERDFVADAGHELRSPLATLRAELELARRPGRSADDLRGAVDGAAEETDRLIRLAEDLLLLARADGEPRFLQREAVDPAALANAAAEAVAGRAAGRGVRVGVEGRSAPVHADPVQLRQVLDNLLANAVRHSPDGGVVRVVVSDGPDGRERRVRASISVLDEGAGFAPEFLPHAFERFRRADDDRSRQGGGSGLGLAIVDSVVRAHGGRAVARNRDGGGAEVTVSLPVDTPT